MSRSGYIWDAVVGRTAGSALLEKSGPAESADGGQHAFPTRLQAFGKGLLFGPALGVAAQVFPQQAKYGVVESSYVVMIQALG
jgi:hypothetical protein